MKKWQLIWVSLVAVTVLGASAANASVPIGEGADGNPGPKLHVGETVLADARDGCGGDNYVGTVQAFFSDGTAEIIATMHGSQAIDPVTIFWPVNQIAGEIRCFRQICKGDTVHADYDGEINYMGRIDAVFSCGTFKVSTTTDLNGGTDPAPLKTLMWPSEWLSKEEPASK